MKDKVLELLGDALVNLVLTEALIQTHPKMTEADLTFAVQSLRSTATMASIAREIGLVHPGDPRPPKDAADALEVHIAKIYKEKGLWLVKEWIRQAWGARISNPPGKPLKMQINELLSRNGLPAAKIKTRPEDGRYRASVFLEEEQISTAVDWDMKVAEERAAKAALAELRRRGLRD